MSEMTNSEIKCENNSRLCKSGAEWCRSCGGFSLNYGKTWEFPTRTPELTKADTRISPHKLYEMAKGDSEKYKELMIIHGHLKSLTKAELNYEQIMKYSHEYGDRKDLVRFICDNFATPTITKEQLLAILTGEYSIAKYTGEEIDEPNSRNIQFQYGYNAYRDLMKQRIEELFK